jgi:hypothetical protein
VHGGHAAAVAQHAHVLLGEQRVAADPAEQAGLDLGGEPVVGQEHGQQAGGVGVAERLQPDGGAGRPPAGPPLQQLGPGGHHHQQRDRLAASARRFQQPLDEVEQGVVGPVQVLKGEDQRPRRRQSVQEPAPGGELLLAVGGGRRCLQRGGGVDADQAAQVPGDPGGGRRVGDRRGHRGGEPALGGLGGVGLPHADLRLDRLGERSEARVVPVGQRAALAPGDRHPGLWDAGGGLRRPGQPVGELGEQAALADPGRPQHGDQLGRAAGGGPAGGLQQHAELGVAGDQGREPGRPAVLAGAGAAWTAAGAPRTRVPVEGGGRGPRRRAARERDPGGRVVGDGPLGRPPGGLGHQHGAGDRGLLQPGAGGEQVAGDPPATRLALLAGADQRLPGGDGGLDPQPRAAVGPGEGVTDGQGGADGPFGVVVPGAGHPEHGDRATADRLLHHAAEGFDLGPDAGERPGERARDVFGVGVGEVLDHLVDVGDEHGDELAPGAGRGGGVAHGPLLQRGRCRGG